MKIKILYVIAALERGGAEAQLRLLLKGLGKERFHVGVLYCHDALGQNMPGNVDYIKVDRGSKWRVLKFWRGIFKEVKSFNPDILHLWLPPVVTLPAIPAGILCKSTIISSQRDSYGYLKPYRNFLGWAYERCYYMQHFFSSKIISNFPVDKEPLLVRWLYKKRLGACIPNSLAEIAVPFGSKMKKTNSSIVLLFVARITPKKRLDVLLDSLSELISQGYKVSLRVVGAFDKGYEEKINYIISSKKLEQKVEFFGFLSQWHYLCDSSDIFILPSMYEGCPNSLIEAMSLGMPSIASDILGIAHWTEDKNNISLVKPGSVESLTYAIKELIENENLRIKLSENAEGIANQFSSSNMVQSYEEVYFDILKEKQTESE